MLDNYPQNHLNNLQSKTDYSTNATTKKQILNNYNLKNSSNLEDFKTKYKEKKTLSNFLNKNCPSFNEDFELIKFISTGGTGVVYEGQMRKKKNKQKLAFKFKYSKKQNQDKDEFQEIFTQFRNFFIFRKFQLFIFYII